VERFVAALRPAPRFKVRGASEKGEKKKKTFWKMIMIFYGKTMRGKG